MDQSFVKKFLKGSISTSLGTLATVAFHFLSITLMTRYISKEQLGLYFLILAIATGFKNISGLGLDLTIVQFLSSREKEKQEKAFAVSVWVQLCVMSTLGILILFMGSYILPYFDPHLNEYRWHLPALFILMSVRETLFYLLQGLRRFKSYAIIQTLSAILKCYLIWQFSAQMTLLTLVYIEFAMLLSSLIVQASIIPFKQLSPPKMAFDRETFREVISFGFPLYINTLFTYVSNFGGDFIIGIFLNPASIAAYEVAGKIPQGISRLFASFRVVYFPSLSNLFAQGDLRGAQKLMNKSLTLLAAGSFTLVAGAFLFSREIVLLIFSADYLDIQLTFALLTLSVCMGLLSSTMGYSLVSAGQPRASTKVNITAMTLELILSILLVPITGYIGVAISYVIMTLLAQIMCYFFLRRGNVTIILKEYLKPYLFLTSTVGTYLLVGSDSLIWRIAIFFSYIALCLIFSKDCRQGITTLWKFTQALPRQAKSASAA